MQTVYANLIYTGSEIIKNRYINFEESKIISISDKPEGEVLRKAEVITPAFIDPHSHIGMVRSGEPSDEEESNETFESIVALADTIDSVYMDDNAFRESIEHGILYSCVLPGSGNIIGGKAALIRNFERTIDKAFIKHVGVKATLGFNPRSTSKWKGKRPTSRMGVIAIFREELLNALKALRLVEKGKRTLMS
ncbi:MAG: amidohydrolase family protein [Candidatus Nezhaarchaeales archaeon]